MKIQKKLTRVLAILLVFVLFYAGITIIKNNQPEPVTVIAETIIKEEPKVTISWVREHINNISEYATLSYQYTNVSKFEDAYQAFGYKLPFTTKRFSLQYDGEMKLGIKAEKIQVDVKKAEEKIYITLPAAEILSHTIFEDSIDVVDQTHNIINQVEIEDYATLAVEEKKVMEAQAHEKNLFEEATNIATKQIKGFLEAALPEEEPYEIIITVENK